MRIRLSSPVVRVAHDGPAESARAVKIAYMQGGSVKAVRTRHCILACYNSLIPALMPEIPQHQKEALGYPAKVPLMYTNVSSPQVDIVSEGKRLANRRARHVSHRK